MESYTSKIKHFSKHDGPKCEHCASNSTKLDLLKVMIEKQETRLKEQQEQNATICRILSEHKILLEEILSKNKDLDTVMQIFPINTKQSLSELDHLLTSQKDLYTRYMKSLVKGKISQNLHKIFGREIVMAFNTDGTHGKDRLRDFKNVYSAIIDAISDDKPEEEFRAALQKEKKKYFKLASKLKTKENKAPCTIVSSEQLTESIIEII